MAIPARKITDFKGQLTGGGARPNLFEVEMAFPQDVSTDATLLTTGRFLVKAANLPASNVAAIDVPFRGRILKVAGDRTFDPWTITVINDADFKLRHAFEKWANILSKLDNNTGHIDPASYQSDMKIYQLGRDISGTKKYGDSGDVSTLRSYKLFGTFPSAVSAIDVSYESTNAIEEFTVELQVLYMEIDDGPGTLK